MIPILSLCAIGSICLAIWTMSYLEDEEKVTMGTGLTLSFYGGTFFTSLYSLINNVCQRTGMGYRFTRKYKLSPADVLDTSNK